MLSDKKICILGSGNMGGALVSGLLQSESSRPENIVCSDISEEKLGSLRDAFGIFTTTDNIEAVSTSDIVIYAVKPQIMAAVLKQTRESLDMSKLIISVAAGVPLVAIESCLDKKLRLVRVMPNVAVAVRAGATAIAAGRHALADDVNLAKSIFDSVGETVFVGGEILMDAVTGLSGSGPAYIFLIVDALADAGVKVGLSRQDSLFLATQTLLGAATLLKETQEHPAKLKETVTSPGGTTIAGLHALEEGRLRATLTHAVEAAAKRSKELGEVMTRNFQDAD